MNTFRLQQFRITCHGISGGRINNPQNILEFEHLIQTHNPHFVVVHLGGNDLDQKSNTWEDVEEIFLRWINILHLFYRRYSVKIAVSQLLFRERTRHIYPVLYNNFVLIANRLLKLELAKLDKITYWNLKGLKDNHQDICWDGVHLNWRSGYSKYYKIFAGQSLTSANLKIS